MQVTRWSPVHRSPETAALYTGAITFTYTLTSDVDASPIPDARIWVTSDARHTNASGHVTFCLDSGTVYVWRQKAGWDFTNPDEEEVS